MAVKFSILSDFAIRALKANKMRSFLTMLGIIIGVGAVVLMMAIGQGEQQQVAANLARLGTNLLMVMPGASGQFGVRTTTTNTMTLGDATAAAGLPGVAEVAPTVRASGMVTYGDQTDTTSTTGTTPAIVDLSSLTIDQGRFFDDTDVQSIAPVAVLGQTVYQTLYPNGGNPVGTQIRIKNVSFTVIGLLQTIGAGAGGGDQDDVIYIPVTTAQIRLQGITNQTINQMEVQAASKDDMNSVQNALEALLRKRHRLSASQVDDFRITNMAQIQQTAESITGILTAFLASVAGISLIVGGIGIMNIMLVSVTERTREIGVRMAIGASRRDILLQFLLEAVMLSLLGALVGIVFGIAGAEAVSLLAKMATPISIASILVSVGFSFAVGVFFGYYPARKAAYLNPADALGYE
ncbi:MAG: ABC transporter permease [Thermacetogeniaceae bacterium]|jgi:putative ABC transport system permease protein